MAIKVFISGICGSHDVRKTQQRVLFILSTLPVDLEIVDVTEPGREQERSFMQEEVKKHNKKNILPPQIFNGDQYCGDYDDFQLAADDDVLMSFLKLEEPTAKTETPITNGDKELPITQNGVAAEEEANVEQSQSKHEEGVEENAETGEEQTAVHNETVDGESGVGQVTNVESDTKTVQEVSETQEAPSGDPEPEKDKKPARESEESEEESEEESD